MGAGVGGIPCAPDNVIVPKAWKTEFLKFCEKLTKWRKERVTNNEIKRQLTKVFGACVLTIVSTFAFFAFFSAFGFFSIVEFLIPLLFACSDIVGIVHVKLPAFSCD